MDMKKINLYESGGFADLTHKSLLVHDSPYFKIINFNFKKGQGLPLHSHDIEGQVSIAVLEGEGVFLGKENTGRLFKIISQHFHFRQGGHLLAGFQTGVSFDGNSQRVSAFPG